MQRLLGIKIDGIFGSKETLPALQRAKKVSQISLNVFLAKAPVAPAATLPKTTFIKAPVVGAKLMCTKNGTQLYNSRQNADKTYSKTEVFWSGGILNFGDEAGTFLAHKSNGDFLIQFGGIKAFVNGLNVKVI